MRHLSLEPGLAQRATTAAQALVEGDGAKKAAALFQEIATDEALQTRDHQAYLAMAAVAAALTNICERRGIDVGQRVGDALLELAERTTDPLSVIEQSRLATRALEAERAGRKEEAIELYTQCLASNPVDAKRLLRRLEDLRSGGGTTFSPWRTSQLKPRLEKLDAGLLRVWSYARFDTTEWTGVMPGRERSALLERAFRAVFEDHDAGEHGARNRLHLLELAREYTGDLELAVRFVERTPPLVLNLKDEALVVAMGLARLGVDEWAQVAQLSAVYRCRPDQLITLIARFRGRDANADRALVQAERLLHRLRAPPDIPGATDEAERILAETAPDLLL